MDSATRSGEKPTVFMGRVTGGLCSSWTTIGCDESYWYTSECVNPRARKPTCRARASSREPCPWFAQHWPWSWRVLRLHAESPRAEFFRGINLNGPPVVIDGHRWEGGDSKNLETRDQAFENQAVPLIPPTDPDRERMIRSSRWNGQAD